MVFNLAKKSLKAVMENPAVNFQLVLYLIIINFLMLYITSYVKISYIAYTLLFVTLFLSFVFSSGWFQVIKESTNVDENVEYKDKIKDKNYFSIFFEGVGKNIIPITSVTIIYTLLFIAVIVITSAVAGALFGDLKGVIKEIAPLLQNPTSLNELLGNLTDSQKYTLYSWQLSFMIVATLFNFIFMFYFPAVIYNTKSNIFLKPFIALKDSVCFIFKNFIGSLSVFVLIYSVYIILSILKHFVIRNSFLTILFLFLFICFISGAIMLIFNYYEQKNLCNNGADRIGQNETIDYTSKED